MARTCPACQGMGTVIQDPCKRCKGEGVVIQQHTLQVEVPAGVEEGTRMLFSGAGDAGLHGGPRAMCMWCCTSRSTQSSSAKAKIFFAPFPSPSRRHHSGRRLNSHARGRGDDQNCRGHADRHFLPAAAQGRARAQRRRARRSLCRGQGPHSDQADQAAARTFAGTRLDFRHREQDREALAAQQSERHVRLMFSEMSF